MSVICLCTRSDSGKGQTLTFSLFCFVIGILRLFNSYLTKYACLKSSLFTERWCDISMNLQQRSVMTDKILVGSTACCKTSCRLTHRIKLETTASNFRKFYIVRTDNINIQNVLSWFKKSTKIRNTFSTIPKKLNEQHIQLCMQFWKISNKHDLSF